MLPKNQTTIDTIADWVAERFPIWIAFLIVTAIISFCICGMIVLSNPKTTPDVQDWGWKVITPIVFVVLLIISFSKKND